jgi:hypothetical protein
LLVVPWRIHLGFLHNSTPISLQLFKPTSISLQLNFLITKTLSF